MCGLSVVQWLNSNQSAAMAPRPKKRRRPKPERSALHSDRKRVTGCSAAILKCRLSAQLYEDRIQLAASTDENMRQTIDDTKVVYYTAYVDRGGAVGRRPEEPASRAVQEEKVLHLLMFGVVCSIVVYACIAFRDDPYFIDPWDVIVSHRQSQAILQASVDRSGSRESLKRLTATGKRRRSVKAAL